MPLTVAPYFKECLSAAELDELNIEIIRNTLYKAYLEDFMSFCSQLPSPTSTVMKEILEFEADRRAINITINSFGTNLSKGERAKLYPAMGCLYPNGTMALREAEDIEAVKLACDGVVEYAAFFEQSAPSQADSSRSLEDQFFEREAHLNKLAFLQQVCLHLYILIVVSLCYCVRVAETYGTTNSVSPFSFESSLTLQKYHLDCGVYCDEPERKDIELHKRI